MDSGVVSFIDGDASLAKFPDSIAGGGGSGARQGKGRRHSLVADSSGDRANLYLIGGSTDSYEEAGSVTAAAPDSSTLSVPRVRLRLKYPMQTSDSDVRPAVEAGSRSSLGFFCEQELVEARTKLKSANSQLLAARLQAEKARRLHLDEVRHIHNQRLKSCL